MKKYIFIYIILLFITTLALAQDPNFSMRFLAPQQLTPAMTGMFHGDIRLIANARNQWSPFLGSKAYNSYSAAMDMNYTFGNDYIGVGVSLLGDKAGTSSFQQNNAKMSLAYCKNLSSSRNKFHAIVAGFEAGMTSLSLNVNDLRFLSQFDKSDIFRPDFLGPEVQRQYRNRNFGDISAGLMWITVMPEYYSFHIGAAMHHINKPNISFVESRIKMLPRYTLNFGGEYYIQGKKWALLPNVIGMRQGKSIEITGGVALRKTLQWAKSEDGYKAFQAGIWFRTANKLDNKILADAVIAFARFDYRQYTFGISYDSNISSLRAANAFNGSYEFAIHYTLQKAFPNKIACPSAGSTYLHW